MQRRLPYLIALACTLLLQAPAAQAQELRAPINAATRAKVIDGLTQQLIKHYIFLDQAQAMAADIRARQQRHEYDGFTDGEAFAARLSENMQAVSHDKHMTVFYSVTEVPVTENDNFAEDQENQRIAQLKAKPIKMPSWPACKPGAPQYFPFGGAECLPGNIGLLTIADQFPVPPEGEPYIAAAMNYLANTRALIIDLRRAPGGETDTVVMIESYLFDHPTPLTGFYLRDGNKTLLNTSAVTVMGKRYGQQKPVYVLTGSYTFSAAEFFAYDLQATRRALTIGATSAGGGHGVGAWRLDPHFLVRVPFANAVNPITKGNWEGTGVKPDVAVNESEALDVAQILALHKLMQDSKDMAGTILMRRLARELQAQLVTDEAKAAVR